MADDEQSQESVTRDGGRQPLPVLFLPGGVNPVKLSYRPLLSVLGDDVRPILKELEVYSEDEPPRGYRLEMEVDGVLATAEEEGLESFHLVGYSGGGAVSLAFTSHYPEMVRSLALVEPAWIGNQNWTEEEQAWWQGIDRAMALAPDKRMEVFLRLNAGAGDPPPQPERSPAWMDQRPAGLAALTRAFKKYNLAPKRFRRFQKPVYLAVGGLSDPSEGRKAERLAALFPDIRVEVYEGLHHLTPPQRVEPERFALALRDLWQRAEEAAPVPAAG